MSDTMNHEEAMKAQTTERYLLGDLPENERDAFEEHYFECAICADEVPDYNQNQWSTRAASRIRL